MQLAGSCTFGGRLIRLVLANARSPRQLDDGAFASPQFLHGSGRPAKKLVQKVCVFPDQTTRCLCWNTPSSRAHLVTSRLATVLFFKKEKWKIKLSEAAVCLQPARHITPGQPAADVLGASNPRVTHRSLGVVYLFALISPRLLLPHSISRLCLTLRASVFLAFLFSFVFSCFFISCQPSPSLFISAIFFNFTVSMREHASTSRLFFEKRVIRAAVLRKKIVDAHPGD